MVSSAKHKPRVIGRLRAAVLLCCAAFAGCTQIQGPKPDAFIAVTAPPPKQELRWSNGQMPRSLDPALAAAAPEADVVRAIYEGLTELDPRTLDAKPAAAEKWEASEDHRTWTFTIRRDARWSNGKRVTAADFASSWRRLLDLGEKAPHRALYANIVGMKAAEAPAATPEPPAAEDVDGMVPMPPERVQTPPAAPAAEPAKKAAEAASARFGVEALSDVILKVSLNKPDEDFPKLVAHPIFRPVYGIPDPQDLQRADPKTVTNGPFRIAEAEARSLVLERADTYWNRSAVALEAIRFIPADSADAGLELYKKGEIDLLTNIAFEPLAMKLLAPFEEFRQTRHSALNFFEVNAADPPLSDRKVREALAISIDREKIAEGDLDGSTSAANSFLIGGDGGQQLAFDPARARDLLTKAGFPNGEGFPELRLIVNRNDTQLRIARTVARMWKQNLRITVTVLPKDNAELQAVRASGDFDLIRRGVVIPTSDERTALDLLFGDRAPAAKPSEAPAEPARNAPARGPAAEGAEAIPGTSQPPAGLTEEAAMYELTAIPVYFPRSYALVKPYVRGFDLNSLDAPLLSAISIDAGWRPPQK